MGKEPYLFRGLEINGAPGVTRTRGTRIRNGYWEVNDFNMSLKRLT